MTRTLLVIGAFSITFALGIEAAQAAWEAKINYVNNHSGSGACGGDNFTYGDDEASYMNSKLDLWGYSETSIISNGGVDHRDWTDIDEHVDGLDHVSPNGTDHADIGFLYTHGGHICDSGSDEYVSKYQMGDDTWYSDPQSCHVWVGSRSGTNAVQWGDTDLNAVIVDACESVHKCVWENGGYGRLDFGNFSALLGFHGVSYDSLNHKNHFKDYMDGVRYNGLGDDWVSDMTKFWGFNHDECATVVAYGATKADRDLIYDYGGMTDFKPRTGNSTTFYFINNCNPYDGEKL